MLTLLDLLDRLIDLLKHRQSIDQRFYADVVTPMLQALDHVHQDYVSAFGVYLSLIKDEMLVPNVDHPLFIRLREDMLFSGHMRARVAAVLPVLTTAHEPLVQAITKYLGHIEHPGDGFSHAREVAMSIDGVSNPRRLMLKRGVYAIFVDEKLTTAEKRYEAKGVVITMMRDLQRAYQVVLTVSERSKAKIASR